MTEFNRDYAKQVSKKVKDFCKVFYNDKKNIYVSMTPGVKYPYIELLVREQETNINHRETALNVIYGETYKQNEKHIAGNIMEHRMAMKPHEWEKWLEIVNK